MSAKERGRANGKVSTLAGHRGTPAGSEMNAINSFTVIEECAIELAVLTLRYRRARHYLIARQIEQALSDDVVLRPILHRTAEVIFRGIPRAAPGVLLPGNKSHGK